MNLYVTRHGQTQYNIENRVCGISDVELTDTGRKQAAAVAKKLKGKQIDVIIVSPLKRAQETAAIINQVVGTQVIVDPRLQEINFGKYEGVKNKNRGFKKTKKNHGFHYPGGESYFQVIHRVYQLLDEIKQTYPHQNVLLVCHGGIVRTIYTYFHDISNHDLYHYLPENCCLDYYQL